MLAPPPRHAATPFDAQVERDDACHFRAIAAIETFSGRRAERPAGFGHDF